MMRCRNQHCPTYSNPVAVAQAVWVLPTTPSTIQLLLSKQQRQIHTINSEPEVPIVYLVISSVFVTVWQMFFVNQLNFALVRVFALLFVFDRQILRCLWLFFDSNFIHANVPQVFSFSPNNDKSIGIASYISLEQFESEFYMFEEEIRVKNF